LSVGDALARAREERGLSVEDVSASTRIRAGLLRAIEADDFGPCGGAVYARGHIRSVAKTLGIDSDPLIAEYDRQHVEEALPVPVPNQPVEPDLVARAERKPPNWTAAMAVAAVVLIIIAGYGLLKNNTNKPSPAAASQTQNSPVTTASTAPAVVPPSAAPSAATAEVPSNVATALIRVTTGQTWLQVSTFSGRLLFQGLLATGASRIFKDAHGLRLVIGNAPAVQLVADNHEYGVPRSSGNVAHVTIQPGGDVQFA
jgi:cytoskeleton protein RodZ